MDDKDQDAWLRALRGDATPTGEKPTPTQHEAELLRRLVQRQADADLARYTDSEIRQAAEQAFASAIGPWDQAQPRATAPAVPTPAPRPAASRHRPARGRPGAWVQALAGHRAAWAGGALLAGLALFGAWQHQAGSPQPADRWRAEQGGLTEQMLRVADPPAQASAIAQRLRAAGATVAETADGPVRVLLIDAQAAPPSAMRQLWAELQLPGPVTARLQLVIAPSAP